MAKLIILFIFCFSVPCLADIAKTIVLIPGAASSGDRLYIPRVTWALFGTNYSQYYGKLKEGLLKKDMHTVVCPETRDDDHRSLDERILDCEHSIKNLNGERGCDKYQKRNIILFGHSMGGLIARALAASPIVGNCIHSVTTLSTPHKGTPIADFLVEKHVKKEFDIIALGLSLFKMTPSQARYLPQLQWDRKKEKKLFKFQDTIKITGVEYYSFSTSLKDSLWRYLFPSALLLSHLQKKYGIPDENDGIVPVVSMKYGKFMGTISSSHFSGICPGPVRFTSGCKESLQKVVSHLQGLYSEITD